MKDQYFGDINDYRKYSLLRLLGSPARFETVVCWALTNGDGGADGSRIQYLGEPTKWRRHDPVVFDCLRDLVVAAGRREVSAIETAGVIPNCRFFSELLKDDVVAREGYFERLGKFAEGADLVFLDPDNGLGVQSVPRGRRNSSKYVYMEEVSRLYRSGASLLIYQHFPRVARAQYTKRLLSDLWRTLGARTAISFRTSHVVFLLLPQPRHQALLVATSQQVLENWVGQVDVGFHVSAQGSSPWEGRPAHRRGSEPLNSPSLSAAS
jgi:hypothetical protein